MPSIALRVRASSVAQREIAVGALVEQQEDVSTLVFVDDEAATTVSSVCTAASVAQHMAVSVRLSLSTTKASHSLPSGSLTQALS